MAQGDFKKRNDAFTCENCGYKVKPAKHTSRNHCPKCLYSKHVDIIPGDRKEICHGLMIPIEYDYKKRKYIIIHKCLKCGAIGRNKCAADDDIDQLLLMGTTA